MDSLVANDELILGIVGSTQTGDFEPDQAYKVLSNWGLEGTHLSGSYTNIMAPYSPFTLEVDLETMIVVNDD